MIYVVIYSARAQYNCVFFLTLSNEDLTAKSHLRWHSYF